MRSKFVIPQLSIEEVTRRYQHVMSIVEHKCYLRELSNDELSGLTYTWCHESNDYRDVVDYSKFFLEDRKMLHNYVPPKCFKSSVSKVLRQISKDLLSKVVAFEILDGAVSYNDVCQDELKAGYHVSIVRLYQAKDDTNEAAKPVTNYPSDDSMVPVGMTQEQFERIYHK